MWLTSIQQASLSLCYTVVVTSEFTAIFHAFRMYPSAFLTLSSNNSLSRVTFLCGVGNRTENWFEMDEHNLLYSYNVVANCPCHILYSSTFLRHFTQLHTI